MSHKGESERRPALPPDSDATILTCRPCAADVSVARGAPPRCPRCGGALERPHDAEGDAPERTLLEVRTGLPADQDAGGSAPDAGADPRLDDARAAARVELRALANTATQGATELGAPPSLVRMGVVREPPPPVEPVRRLGQYELRRVLGKGGMGVVYEAWQPALGRAVALKVMSAAEASEEELERFDREARAAAKLQHKGIVPIYEVGAADGRAYFTMDLVRGRTLQEMARAGTLAPEDAARLVAGVARAIHYAHEKGIIHRDLKPSNVLVDEQGEPHVTDFGLAKDVSDQSGLTLTGVAMGSPPYMPPEQARGEFRRVDAVSDVYGLGTILYECLTGSPPFTGKSVYDIIAKVLVEEPAPPRRKNPATSLDLETICLKALEKEKWRRYPTAEAMAQDLERLLAGRTIEAVRHGLTTRIGRGIERHRWQIVSILVPLAVAVGIIGYLVGGQPQHPGGARSVGPAIVEDRGAVANVARDVRRAVEHLAPLDGPTWREVATSLEHLPDDLPARATLARDVEARLRADPDGRVPSALVAPLVEALVGDPSLDARDVAATVAAWYGVDGPLAEVAAGAVLAHRGAVLRDPAAYRMALAGPRTPIDVGIVDDAARSLAPLFRGHADPRAAAAAAVTSDVVLTRAALRMSALRRDATGTAVLGHGWVFPPVTWPGAPDVAGPARPVAQGLLGRGSAAAPPTEPLLTGDGAHVLVGWLRFLYVLDEPTGRVLRRARLPGAARGLEWDASGAARVRVWDGARERHVLARLPADRGQGPVELRWSDDGRERPVSRLDLLPLDDTPAADEQRRVACAFFPALDDRLDVFEERAHEGPEGLRREARVARVLRLNGRPRLGLTLALSPSPDVGLAALAPSLHDARGDPIAARVVAVAPDGSAAGAGLRPGDLILRADAPTPSTLELRVRRPRPGLSPREHVLEFAPRWVELAWEDVAARAAALAAADPDPNPWLLAFAAAGAVQREDAADPARGAQLAGDAVRSEHLTPWERVELACFLDRWGLEQEAERGLTRALAELLREHAYAPDLAGYGTHDAGRAIADRVVAHRLAGRHERAAALARWRDAFAPALVESADARRAYERLGAPPLPAPPSAPRKGVAGLQAIDVLRLDHAIRLQVVLITFLGAFLTVLLVRYRRHAIRDLDRLQVRGPLARWRLWLQRPWTRLAFTWPTYITLSDKLAFIVLYVFYFMALSVHDAGFDVLAALRRGHDPLLSGVPASIDAVRGVAREVPPGEPDPTRAYALLWGLLARGDLAPQDLLATLGPGPAAGTPDEASLLLARCRAALAARGEPRDRLLLAEVHLVQAPGAGAAEAGADLEAAARGGDPEVAAAAAVLAGDASPGALESLAAASPRQRLALEFAGGPARPLSPPPTTEARDALVVGRGHWWSVAPTYLLRNLTQPVPGTVDASLVAFEEAWSLNLAFARLRNSYFFLVPASVLVLVILLLVRTPRWFEPLASDLAPPRGVRLLSLAVPGLPQVMRGRSVRGVFLLAPFVYVAQTLYNARQGFLLVGWLQEFARFDAREIAALTAEAAPAVAVVRVNHAMELVGLLALLYVWHWVDLALARRKLARAGAEAARPRQLIVPVDSEVGLSSAPGSAPPPPRADGVDGPFDSTEPGRPRRGASS